MDAAAEGAIDADGGGGAVRERGERRARGISLGEVFFFLRRVWVIAAVLICFPVVVLLSLGGSERQSRAFWLMPPVRND